MHTPTAWQPRGQSNLHMHIKVRIDIRKPLMRGVTLEYVRDRSRGTRNLNGWRSGSGGSRNSFGGMGSIALTTGGGSDAPFGGNRRLMGRKWA